MDGYPDNFLWSGVASGVKRKGRLDLGLVYSSFPSTVVGVFTDNSLPAAPVVETRRKLAEYAGFHALLVNSGVANAATGSDGITDARQLEKRLAGQLNIAPEQVISASTGYIGRRLPLPIIYSKLPDVIDGLQSAPEEFSRAILTTDTCTKTVRIPLPALEASLFGVAKGSGMINPRMATMLAFFFLDYPVRAGWLKTQLVRACEGSFNQITVDGDRSTNDTVLAWAAELPGRTPVDGNHPQAGCLTDALHEGAEKLAMEIVRDGEGATKTIEIQVAGASTSGAAARVASAIADSPLVRTAFVKSPPNWGRIYSSIGAAGVALKPEKLAIKIDGTLIFAGGKPVATRAEQKKAPPPGGEGHLVQVELGLGDCSTRRVTCDLTEQYVQINAGYS